MTGNPRPPRYLSKHAKETAVTLAQKAKEVSLSVHEILKTEGTIGGFPCVSCNHILLMLQSFLLDGINASMKQDWCTILSKECGWT